MLRRTDDELDRLGLQLGRGLAICGAAGTGKTLIARATANAIGRPAIVPPTGELTASLISRLYAQLAKMEPTVVILDEAESLIGQSWARTGDPGAAQALLAALDGVNTPRSGPITLALTTVDPTSLEPAAVRPGRLAPTLQLDPPSPAERRELLTRAIRHLPIAGEIDLEPIIERTGRWTGAELVGAVQEACATSLVDHIDALRQDLLLAVIAERYIVRDDVPTAQLLTEATAIHEVSHAVFAEVAWPGSVTAVEIAEGRGGLTHLSDGVDLHQTVGDLRASIAFSLAGTIGEELCLGADGVGRDNARDQVIATQDAMRLIEMEWPYSPSTLEGSRHDGMQTGSEHMRAAIHVAVAKETEAGRRRAIDVLAAHLAVVRSLAVDLMSSPERALSGEEVRAALQASLA
jgi:SpoVK/Ycf46/Vps4 family AAA+-type ATPase